MRRVTAGTPALFLAIAFLGGCGRAEKPVTDVPARSYEMRGMVRQISAPDAEERQIWIHHEAVADFVDIRGKAVPMDAMTMPFLLADSVDLSRVEPGAKVSFSLVVDWSAGVPVRIDRLETLPLETQLSFEEGGAEEPAEHSDP